MGILNIPDNFLKMPEFLKKKMPAPPKLNICMMGPRSVGKTTVLTSIFFETQENICGSKLYMTSMDANTSNLINYHTMLVDAVAKGNASNLPASNTELNFNFGIGMKGQDPTLLLNVQDFPGEYLISNPEEVNRYVAGATVILIAIDTPYLMEEKGKYNLQKNKVDVVTGYLKNNQELIRDKMVLFVPLKCELYMHNGCIDEVSTKVKESYSELISFFEQNNIASFVTPILTLGGLEFDRMVDNNTGIGDVEKLAVYKPYTKAQKYAPAFCSQPLYYLLAYTSNFHEWQKKNKKAGFLRGVLDSLNAYFMKDSEFYEEVRKMSRFILYGKNGYLPLTTNTIIKIN